MNFRREFGSVRNYASHPPFTSPICRDSSVSELMINVNLHFLNDTLTNHPARFVPGQVVSYWLGEIRGVIVACDGHCQLDPACYMAEYPQPDRDQPWYYLLAEGIKECQYVAEEDLQLDESGFPVEHPLIDVYFEGFFGGRHVRNALEWPE